jgi:HK97 family phage portal protein
MAWYHKLFGGGKKEKGINLSVGGFEILQKIFPIDIGKEGLMEQYSKSLYIFACISKIGEKIGSIPLNLTQVVNSKGDLKQISSHPALDLIYRPNKLQTKNEFLMTTVINKKTAGDAFIYKVKNASGRPVELWNLRPDRMTIMVDPAKVIGGYKFLKDNGTFVMFEPEEIIHIKDYPNPFNVYEGISALMPTRIRAQTEEYATRYQRDFFINSARPDAIITSERAITKKQEHDLRKRWIKKHGGIKNSSKIGFLGSGLKYEQISITQKDMDYIEGIKMTRDDILIALKTPKSVLGITEDVNRANAETGMYVYLSETIVPEMNAIVEKLNEEMTYIDFGENIFYSYPDPTPANREMQLKEYENGIKNNWLLINEIRQRENLPPVKGGYSFYMPLMNVAMGGLPIEQQKKMMKAILADSDRNEKIILKSREPERFDFKGKFMLKQKMELLEYVSRRLIDTEKKKSGKSKGMKKPLISDREIRKMYWEAVNKTIDTKSFKLKESMNDFAEKQKERVLSALSKKSIKALSKKFEIGSIFNKEKEFGLTLGFIIPFIEEFLKDAGMESLNTIAPQEEFRTDIKRIRKFIEKRSSDFAESVGNTTLEKLTKTLAEGIAAGEKTSELADRVNGVYGEFPEYRSAMIARTEATAANNEGILESFRQSEVVNAKEWITMGDERVRPEHAAMDGEIVKNDENFSNGMPYPGEPNCRCVLGGAFIED